MTFIGKIKLSQNIMKEIAWDILSSIQAEHFWFVLNEFP